MTRTDSARGKATRHQRGHLCQCGTGCHGPGPCEAPIDRGLFVSQPDPFHGGRHPAVFVRLCGACAEWHLSTETGA